MFHINNELDRQLQEVDEILSSVNTSYDYYDTGGGSGNDNDDHNDKDNGTNTGTGHWHWL